MHLSRATLGIVFGLAATAAIAGGVKLKGMYDGASAAVSGVQKSEQQYVIETGAKGRCEMLRPDLQPACRGVEQAYAIKF